MDIVWRTKLGERGRIQTGQLKTTVMKPCHDVSMKSISGLFSDTPSFGASVDCPQVSWDSAHGANLLCHMSSNQ